MTGKTPVSRSAENRRIRTSRTRKPSVTEPILFQNSADAARTHHCGIGNRNRRGQPGRITRRPERASKGNFENSGSVQFSCRRLPPPDPPKDEKFQKDHPNLQQDRFPYVRPQIWKDPRLALLQQIATEAEPIERVEQHVKELRQLRPDSGIREKQQIASAAEEQTERRPPRQRSDDQDKPGEI